MQISIWKKGLVLGIIVLFVVVSFTPSISSDIKKIDCANKKDKIRNYRDSYDNPPEEEWRKTFGSIDYYWSSEVQQTTDGGYILVATKTYYESGERDIWLIKTDSNGDEQWSHTYGEGNSNESANSVQQTADGGYIIGGTYNQFINPDIWIELALFIKTDEDGNEEWNKTLGVDGYNETYSFSTRKTTDGGYFIAGMATFFEEYDTTYHAFLIKTDENGTKEWENTFGGDMPDDACFSAEQTSDEGYILTGSTSSYATNSLEIWLIKTDSNGDEQWNYTYGPPWPYISYGRSVQQTSDGGYIITGRLRDIENETSYIPLVKTDENGTEEWNTTFDGHSAESVLQTIDGDYIIAGVKNSGGLPWLIKTDGNGNEIWNTTFDGYLLASCKETSDYGYIILGETGDKVLLIKTTSDNEIPIAHFTFTPEDPTNEDIIQFFDNSTDPDGTIESLWWDFGDNYYYDLQNPVHCYNTAGEYTLNLTVTDNLGVKNSYEKIIDISNVSGFIIELLEGWNMIGWYHQYDTMASYLAENITNCTLVSWFNASSQSFETYIVGGPPQFDFPITKGMGIFVLIDSDRSLLVKNVFPRIPETENMDKYKLSKVRIN